MKKVLLLGSELGKGGAERSISLLSYYLEQEGYDVTLAILSGTDREQFYKTCKNVVFIDPPPASGVAGKIKAWRYRLRKVKQLKRDNNIDVCISFLEGPDYVNVMTRGREKVVLSIRGSKMHDKVIAGAMGAVRKKILIPLLYKRADEVVCVTKALANELTQHFGIPQNSLTTIYNFYETEVIRKQANEPLTSEEQRIYEKPVIISSGRLHVAKEFDKLVQILQLIKKDTDARLMILGDGELKSQLTDYANSLGLTCCDWVGSRQDADVYFMGFQKNAFKYYQHSSLFALSSSWEGFPNVLAEALICGIPVITTDCYTGPREILDVPNLPNEPVKLAVETKVGTLLPLLTNPTDNELQLWATAAKKWLEGPRPPQHDFDNLTNRFTLAAMLQQWKRVIDN